MSQKIVQFVEIDVDYCALTYGVAPCQAALNEDAVLLLHMDGLGTSPLTQNFTDTSLKMHGNGTKFGNVAIVSGGQFSDCGQFDGAGDYVTFPNSSDWEFGAGDFTVEWFEFRTANSGATLSRDAVTTFVPFILGYPGSSRLDAYITSDGANWDIANGVSMGSLTLSVWSHRAITRSGTTFRTFKDGTVISTFSSSAAIFPNTGALSIGRTQGFLDFTGKIDELRILKGKAKWTANFTPPAAPYANPTGEKKCFNTLVTCQDRPNFTNDPVTLRFAVPTDFLPKGLFISDNIPNIKTIQFDPAVISLGKDLGQRATLTATFNDHRHSDAGEGYDKYVPDRDYNPYEQGTYWGKFAARQPFVRGRPLRWITGNTDQFETEMEVRHFVIDSFSGPTNNGEFKIIAKDVLKLADGDRALAPTVSQGFLSADITNAATSFTVAPSGIGATYPTTGLLAIGGTEIVAYSSRTGDTFTISARGFLGTTAAAHSAQDRVQWVLNFNARPPNSIIAELLVDYAGVNPSYIPGAQWQSEVDSYLNRLYTANIAQPTAVVDLVSELIEQAGLSMWWDDRNQKIGLLVLRGLVYTNYLFDENNMMLDTLDVSEQPDKRVSQVHTYFGQINPLTSLTDKANYRSNSIVADPQSESDYGSAAIKEIFSRWIPALGRTVADRLGTIFLGRFRDPPRKLKFSMLRNSVPEILLGQGYQARAWPLQLDTGEAETVNLQVTRLRPNPDTLEVEAEEVLFTAPAEDLTVRRIIVDANNHNINLRATHDSLFPAPEVGTTVVLTVNTGVILGSTSSATFSLDIGSWPAGVTIIVHIEGRIQGKGGTGDSGAAVGTAGGTAIYTRQVISLSCPGQIWAGGGGGGYSTSSLDPLVRNGGGGGAGFDPGPGGAAVGGGVAGLSGTTEAGALDTFYGGGGGGPAQAGHPGGGLAFSGGFGPGNSIDGISFITTGTWDGTTFTPGALTGDVRGAQIN